MINSRAKTYNLQHYLGGGAHQGVLFNLKYNTKRFCITCIEPKELDGEPGFPTPSWSCINNTLYS